MDPVVGTLQQAKLVLLGDMGAGKSSLVLRFVKGQFFDYQESTIGAAFLTKTIPDLNVKFEIWFVAASAAVAPPFKTQLNSSRLGLTRCKCTQGHRGAGAVPQPGPNVLPRRGGGGDRVRHHL
mmetsp:Transcript_37540/g.96007  ORF Transcript_37540/g.96007 Transcript_37540/m.96007 type:complete len:123 (+) Transcript_37540:96-464(+)